MSVIASPAKRLARTRLAPSEVPVALALGDRTSSGRSVPALAGRTLIGAFALLWPGLVLLGLWQAWVSIGDVDTIVMPAPVDVGRLLVRDPGFFLGDLAYTLSTAAIGLAAGTLLGAVIAVAAHCSPLLAGLVTPPALVVRSVPIVAMIPVIASLFGYQFRSVLIVAVLISFFPSFVLVSSGLRSPPPGALDLMAVMGGSRWQRFRHIAWPSAVPNLFVAVRMSASVCIMGALVAEYLLGTRGLGDVFMDASLHKETEQVWAVAVIATTLSVAAYLLASRLERWTRARWT